MPVPDDALARCWGSGRDPAFPGLNLERTQCRADSDVVAGDFNDWGTGLGRRMAQAGFREWREKPTPTYPSRLPLNQLDHVYARGLTPVHAMVPTGRIWQRMSDHLPLVAEFAWND